MKRRWARGEKLLWLAPLLFALAAFAALWAPQIMHRMRGLPDATLTVTGTPARTLLLTISDDGATLVAVNPNYGVRPDNGAGLYFWDARMLHPDARWNLARNRALQGGTADTMNAVFAIAPDAQSFAFSHQNIGGKSKPFLLFDLTTDRVRWQLAGMTNVSYTRFSPDGKIVGLGTKAGADAIEFLMVRVADGRVMSRWTVPNSRHLSGFARFVWTPDSQAVITRGFEPLVPGEKDLEKVRYPLETRRVSDGHLVRSFPTRAVAQLDASRDGKNLVAVTFSQLVPGGLQNFQVNVWDATTGRELWKWPTNFQNWSAINDAEFSPDGTMVAVFIKSERKIQLFDAQTGELQRTLALSKTDGGFGTNDILVWAPDGKRLFVAGTSNEIFVWNLN